MTDTKQNVMYATGGMFGYPVDLKKMQTVPMEIYNGSFAAIDDTEHDCIVRCGKL